MGTFTETVHRIDCDACGEVFYSNDPDGPDYVREHARRNDWQCNYDGDICPDCIQKKNLR